MMSDHHPKSRPGSGPARLISISSRAGPSAAQTEGPGLDPPPRGLLLRILATTDIHANILSYDYAANRPMNGQGLAQMASLIADARAQVPGAILLDNGDFLQGSALADLAAQGRRRRGHPVIAAMNALGYDAATLGNHEFNFGLGVLGRALDEAQFPVISANVLRRRDPCGPLADEGYVPPFVILDRVMTDDAGRSHTLRLGILGLTPPEITRWDQAHLQGRLTTRPMLETARAWAPEMRRRGADLVICLAHTGLAEDTDSVRNHETGVDLAEVPGIDAIVLGHSHLVFPDRTLHSDVRVDSATGRLAGKPAVQPGYAGSHLGLMDLWLRPPDSSRPEWTITETRTRAQSVSEVAAGLSAATLQRHTKALRDAVGSDHRAALAWTRRTLGQCDLAMSTAFAQVADVPALRLTGQSKIHHTRQALSGTPYADLPVLAETTPYRAGGRGGPLNYSEIAKGPLSVRHVFNLYPFPNTLVAVRVTGATLAEHLESGVSIYNLIRPHETGQPLLNPAFPSHGFLSVQGVSYEVDLTQPARYDARGQVIEPRARRIRNLRHAGQPLVGSDSFVLVTNSFRASGSAGIPAPRPEDVLLDRHELCTEVLECFIRQSGRISSQTLHSNEGWRLAPVPGASVIHDTGPGAMDHLDDVADLRPEFAGLSDEGFHRILLHL
jgi:2',3'-cyclic-nucleotide 2'-phosphodiesterase/3'-nucleotidase